MKKFSTISRNAINQTKMNYLFICSRNQWRSPTAERIFAKDYGIHTRSAGTSAQAKRKITANDIAWADVIFVMEHKHKQRIKADFAKPCQFKTIVVLDIPDAPHQTIISIWMPS